MQFPVDTLVDVRYSPTTPWYPGVVTGISPNEFWYVVTLDAPQPTRLEWTEIPRPLGDDSLVTQVNVYCHVEKLAPGQLIKARGA